ncbi:MAG: protein kinase [Planctomycetaceae bacterium]|nr:protein kinase [Planctomycetaceae bacterium]
MIARLHCDRETLESFAFDRLGRRTEEVASHIETCEVCQQQLERLACGEFTWDEVGRLLTPDATDEGSDANAGSLTGMQLRFLEETDHPNSLGRFARYEIMEVLGRGGMGVVLRAYDPALNRSCAIKVLSPQLAGSANARRRFSREAKSAAAVVHPHVVPIQTVDEWNGLPYLIMPIVGGQSLQRRIEQAGPLNITETVRIAEQIARGLTAAHAQGLVHRDIKPANILLENGVERVQITDFGLARAIDDASMTRSGVIAGTPQYMSPEQAHGDSIDHRSDLFSLGSVMYAMLTGRSPFRAETTMGVLSRISHDTPRSLRDINPDVPVWLEQIVMRLLEKSPDNRYASAETVAELLESCLAHLQQPASVSLPEELAQMLKPSARTSRSIVLRWTAVLFGGVAAIAAVALIIVEMNKGTLRIRSDGDVPIRVLSGHEVVDELTVSASGTTIRVGAGEYRIEVDGEFPEFTVKDGIVALGRHETKTVTIEWVQKSEPAVSGNDAAQQAETSTTIELALVIDPRSSIPEAEQLRLLTSAIELRGGLLPENNSDGILTIRHSAQHAREIRDLLTKLRPVSLPDDEATTRARLQRLAEALLNYCRNHQHFPAAVIYGKHGQGGPPHSWRVELLPYLDQMPLYESYRFDEPWDSEANQFVLQHMPEVFRSPKDKESSVFTSFFGVTMPPAPETLNETNEQEVATGGADGGSSGFGDVGEPGDLLGNTLPHGRATLFGARSGTPAVHVTDGTSNTIALVEAHREIPWTQPVDIEFVSHDSLRPGGWFSRGWHAAFADGTVRFLAHANDEQTVRCLRTINDGFPVTPQTVHRLEVCEALQTVGEESTGHLSIVYSSDEKPLFLKHDAHPILTEDDVRQVRLIDGEEGRVSIEMTVSDEAGARLLTATKRLSEHDPDGQGWLTILFDGVSLMTPRVRAPIAKKLQIEGRFDREQAERVVCYLQRRIVFGPEEVRTGDTDSVRPAGSGQVLPAIPPPGLDGHRPRQASRRHPRFETPEALMTYAAECQKTENIRGFLDCWTDEPVRQVATQYLLVAVSMLNERDKLPSVNWGGKDAGQRLTELKSLIAEECADHASTLTLVALLASSPDTGESKAKDFPQRVEATMENSLTQTLSLAVAEHLTDPRRFVVRFDELMTDGEDEATDESVDRTPFNYEIRRNGELVTAVEVGGNTEFLLVLTPDGWLISNPWYNLTSEKTK